MDMLFNCVRFICEKVNWECGQFRRGLYINDPSIHVSEDDDHSVILFAAFVKAEVARRGWFLEIDHRHGRYDHLCFVSSKNDYQTAWFLFDPTDPFDEAHEIINAAAEALRMEE